MVLCLVSHIAKVKPSLFSYIWAPNSTHNETSM